MTKPKRAPKKPRHLEHGEISSGFSSHPEDDYGRRTIYISGPYYIGCAQIHVPDSDLRELAVFLTRAADYLDAKRKCGGR